MAFYNPAGAESTSQAILPDFPEQPATAPSKLGSYPDDPRQQPERQTVISFHNSLSLVPLIGNILRREFCGVNVGVSLNEISGYTVEHGR